MIDTLNEAIFVPRARDLMESTAYRQPRRTTKPTCKVARHRAARRNERGPVKCPFRPVLSARTVGVTLARSATLDLAYRHFFRGAIQQRGVAERLGLVTVCHIVHGRTSGQYGKNGRQPHYSHYPDLRDRTDRKRPVVAALANSLQRLPQKRPEHLRCGRSFCGENLEDEPERFVTYQGLLTSPKTARSGSDRCPPCRCG